MLKADNLSIGYPAGQVVFDAINLGAQKGEMIALLGVNGIGKSTLLKTIAGLQPLIGGSVQVEGKEITEMSAQLRATQIAIVLTERVLIDHMSVADFIALGRAPYTGWMGKLSDDDKRVIERVIALMKIEKLRNKLFNRLSDGERQKVLIARALCQETELIIMDEPTAFLDFRNKKEILDLLASVSRQMNNIIIFSTHDIEAALTYCNKFWIMTETKEFFEIGNTKNYREEVLKKLYAEQLNS